MRVAFFGTPAPAVPALNALLEDRDISVPLVVANPDRPRGRGYKLQPPPVKVAATAAGVPVAQPSRVRSLTEDLRALEVQVCAVAAYGKILPADLLAVPRMGFVNLHFSLLPAWRGPAPVPQSILHGDRETGVTCFVIDEGMDTGPILLQARTPIGPRETAGELTERLAELGAPLLVKAVKGFAGGELTPRPQDHERATYAPKITTEDARLEWSAPADEIDRRVRAYQPVPGAFTTFSGNRLKVHRVRVVAGGGEPGTVLRVEAGDDPAGGPVVACGRDAVYLQEVQPAGRTRMTGIAFANGYRPEGHRLGANGG